VCFPVFSCLMIRPPPSSTLSYTTLFRSQHGPPRQAGHPSARSSAEAARGYRVGKRCGGPRQNRARCQSGNPGASRKDCSEGLFRSEEHTSELQSQSNIVCRLLTEKKKKT